MNLKTSLLFFFTLAIGLECGYKIGRNNPIPLQHQFDAGWQRGYQSGLDAGEEKEKYYEHHTTAYKRGWTACMEQF